MNTLLILATVLFAGLLNKSDRETAYIYCLAVLSFNLLEQTIPDEYGAWSYILAGLTDLAIILILSHSRSLSKYTLRLQQACIAFIVVNFIGWVIFMNYLPPDKYTDLCTLVYAWVFLITTLKGLQNVVGNTSVGGRNDRVYINADSSVYKIPTDEKARRS